MTTRILGLDLSLNHAGLVELDASGAVTWRAFVTDKKGAVTLWEGANRHPLPLGHSGPVYSVAFNNDGKLLASAGGDYKVVLWNPVTRQPVNFVRNNAGPPVTPLPRNDPGPRARYGVLRRE